MLKKRHTFVNRYPRTRATNNMTRTLTPYTNWYIPKSGLSIMDGKLNSAASSSESVELAVNVLFYI